MVIGRAYLVGAFAREPARGVPKAAILLNPRETGRNKRMCRAFVEGVPSIEDLERSTDAKLIPTYWLLRQQLAAPSLRNCKQLLAAYDYGQAQALMALYGRADSKGPILVAVDTSDDFLVIDFARANERDTRRVLNSWFQRVPVDGQVVSVTIWDRIRPTVCSLTREVATDLGQRNPDPSKASSYVDLATLTLRSINLWSIGALIVGRTFNAALCPTAVAPRA